jgi:hypothetical protein
MSLDKSKLGWIALGVVLIGVVIVLFIVLRSPGDTSKRPIWNNEEEHQQNKKIMELQDQLDQEKRQRWELGKLALQSSDEIIRPLVQALSSRPEIAKWLINENLIIRFVSAVDRISRGESPREHVMFMAPENRFQVRQKGDDLVVDPASYRRYEPLTEVFVSLDTEGSIELYRQLQPLFREAYRQLGYPEGNFEEALKKSIVHLLQTPIVKGDIYLSERVVSYQYTDPMLEGLSSAQKHLLRMGPKNVQRIQSKLREMSTAFGIPEKDLPAPRTYMTTSPNV